jgi:hypothetical protein
MQIDKIITLANSKVRLRFLAMERSLRSVGCDLPIWVIPYDENRFELPPNSFWWEIPELIDWLRIHKAHPTMRKYQCLTVANYQFVDSDVVFLSNPQKALENAKGFVTSCGHWNNPGHTYTKQSLQFLENKSTLWQKFIFNTGQFACDIALYTLNDLKTKAELDGFNYTCLYFPYHEQPGINLLVNATSVHVNNLTLAPDPIESTWAGDYKDNSFASKWNDQNKPYLIHWAGCIMDPGSPIDNLFYNYLTEKEKEEWREELRLKKKKDGNFSKYYPKIFNKIKKVYHIIKE